MACSEEVKNQKKGFDDTVELIFLEHEEVHQPISEFYD